MTYINPLAISLPQSFVVEHESSTEKTRQKPATPPASRSAAAQGDHFEHTVESPEGDAPIHEEARQKRQQQGRRRRHHQEEPTEAGTEPAHIDLKA
jgi:hypothetical protein